MSIPNALKYRAFLSYAHADQSWGRWLHRQLEAFRIDKDLVGGARVMGPVPKTLRPIFRDREDFTGGHSLNDATIAALDASAALVVLCSAVSATRPAVNEEVRLFRSRHPDRPVIPVIIDGTYPDNLPLTLRCEIAADGTITNRPVTILGPDLRDTGDGKTLGLAKVVAGLTGLSPDDIFRRAERARRRSAMVRNGVIALVLTLSGAGGFFGWRSYHVGIELADRRQVLAEVEAVVARYGGSANAAGPGGQQRLGEAISAIASGAATDTRYAKALELIKAGKPLEAEPLLRAVAEDKARRVQSEAKQAAEAYRNLGAIAGLADPRRAHEAYRRAVELDPDNVDALFWLGWLDKEAGALESAERAYRRLIALHAKTPNSREVYWARLGLGDIRAARGDLSAAKADYISAQELAERLAKADPGNGGWQRNRSVSHDKVGDMLVAQGNLPAALESYGAALAIRERLAKADPGNASWQSDLSVSHNQIGDVLVAQGNLPATLESYRAALAIRERLAKADPGNAGWQRDLSVSHNSFGDVLVAQGNLPAALESYGAALAIAERLAKADPGNAGSQRDLSVPHNKVGDVLVAQGNLPAALESYGAALAIAERLAKADPSNAGWQRDLSVSHNRIGDVLVAQGNLPATLESYRAALAIRERLAKADRGNAGWQRDLSVSHNKIGGVLLAQGNLPAALESYGAALAIAERLANADPGNAGWQRDLSVSHNSFGDVVVAQGNLPAALESYGAALAIAERLAKADPGNARWQRDLAWSHGRVAMVLARQGSVSDATAAFDTGRTIITRLREQSPDNATLPKDLAWFEAQIASLRK